MSDRADVVANVRSPIPQSRGFGMHRNTLGLLTAMAAIAAIALGISACGGGNSGSVAPPKTASGGAATVGVASAGGLGKILVDSHGRTLYLFQKDKGTQSACTGECATIWPPLRTSSKPAAGTSVSASKLTTAARSDGKPQVAYNGHPLYLYTADKQPGDTNGQGINAFGAKWFALSPAGTTVTGGGSNSSGPSY
jgi:predicted lipoprotein with Yx(FWY)xxD motif